MKNDSVKLVVFNLDDGRYALNLFQVERVIRAVQWAPLPQAPDKVIGVIDVAGRVIPLLNIRTRFGLSAREVGAETQFIIARTVRRTVAFVVDQTRDIVERSSDEIINASSIVPGMERTEGIVRLEDGLAFIHDLDTFLSLDEERVLDDALRESAPT